MSLKRLRAGICRRVYLITVLLRLSPKGSISSLPFSSIVTIIFLLSARSKLVIFVVSSTLTPFFFLLRSFIRLVRGTTLADSLFRLFTSLFWATFTSPFPFPSAVCGVSSLIAPAFLFCSPSLIGVDTQNGRGHFFAACW